MADTLQDFAAGGFNSQYLKVEAGVPIEGIYLGYTMEDDRFNPGKKRVVYEIEVNQQKKFLGSGSKRLAQAMLAADPTVGEFVRITRKGAGFETDYLVETQDIPF